MAARWQYSAEELAEALAAAAVDPHGWLSWTERDERDFGSCVTPEDFASQYAHTRGLSERHNLLGRNADSVLISEKKASDGGFNSGRPRKRVWVEQCLPLDVSFLRRLDCFRKGSLRREKLTWHCRGQVSATAWIDVILHPKERPRAVVRMPGLEPQTIWLTYTRPNLGGRRWWFLCESGRRCRTLYLTPGGDRFRSRQAANIAYRSNALGFSDRIRWRAEQLRDSLPGAKYETYPPRPKGMHRKTYGQILNRLREADENAQLVCYASMKKTADKLGLLERWLM